MSYLKYCVQCPFHERVADPDPYDWFDVDKFSLYENQHENTYVLISGIVFCWAK